MADICLRTTRLTNDSGSKLRVDNLHYDLTEQDLKVWLFDGKSMAQQLLIRSVIGTLRENRAGL